MTTRIMDEGARQAEQDEMTYETRHTICDGCGSSVGGGPYKLARHLATTRHKRGGMLKDRISKCPTCGRIIFGMATCYHGSDQ